jgi:phage shock protein A
MAGRLVERVNRLIRSGIANVTEASGDLDAQAQRAFSEHALHLVRDKLGRLVVERRKLVRQLADLPANVERLSGKAELAVRKGREDLACAAIEEVARLEDGKRGLEEAIKGLDADIGLLEDAIAQLTGASHPALSDQSGDARLRALLAEFDRLASEPEDKRRQSQEP